MENFQHLTWSITSSQEWRESGGAAQTFQKEIESTIEVWVGQTSTFYRVNSPIINESNNLELQRQEFELRSNFAIMQTFDCRNTRSHDKWDVCFVQVIPAFGDPRISDVNLLQFPLTELFTRLMLLGKVPTNWNELQFENGADKFSLKTWDEVKKTSKLKSDPRGWTKYSGSFVNHKLVGVSITNGYGGRALRNYDHIQFDGNQIVKFTRSDETIQSKRLTSPRLVSQFELKSVDNNPPNIEFKKGATVFDFRHCNPVALNQFPDKTCPPKTYKWSGDVADMKTLATLDVAGFNIPPPPKQNPISPMFIGITVVAGLIGLASFFKLRKR